MPRDYEAIKREINKEHQNWTQKHVKEVAAKITNAQRKKEGRPPAKFHHSKP
jgi:hypothetical protein